MSERYYVEGPITGDRVRLTGPEAHHLTNVMRAKIGDEVVLFNDTNREYVARIAETGKRDVMLEVTSQSLVDRELRRAVTLCSALPRGDRQRFLIEKAVELGVHRFVPLNTKRSVVEADDDVCERLRRMVLEASKQCGRNKLMEIATPSGLPPRDESISGEGLKLLAHPGGALPLSQFAEELRRSPTVPAAFLVGPEGGFTDEEVFAALAAGWQAVDLGPRILRIETAATTLAAWAAML
jgi:16S rRNA (uracil1498-N3)-methyltransferase